MASRRTRAAPRPRTKAAGHKPPAFLVTSPEAETASRDGAARARAERFVREGKPWEALRELGFTKPKPEGFGPGGRRAIDKKDLEDLAGLFVNLCTAPAPPRGRLYPRWRQLSVFLDHAADVVRAQREGAPLPPWPAELDWSPDCDVPMPPAAALRNLAAYAGVSERWAWELLQRAHRENVLTDPLDRETLARHRLPRPRNAS